MSTQALLACIACALLATRAMGTYNETLAMELALLSGIAYSDANNRAELHAAGRLNHRHQHPLLVHRCAAPAPLVHNVL